ncbi:MAG: hypothetical protein K6T29_02940 [Peptococcaceae bacterium]|nr:hypothetical protein [Peptococcaceae bacterium]
MKIALPVRSGCLSKQFEDADFFAILKADGEKTAVVKIIKLTALEKEYGNLARLFKKEGVDKVVVGNISAGALSFFKMIGLEVVSGEAGEAEQVAGIYLKAMERDAKKGFWNKLKIYFLSKYFCLK